LRTPDNVADRLFSGRPVSLRSSGLHPFGTVLEIRMFGVTYKVQRKEVLPLLSDWRERLISKLAISRFESFRLSQPFRHLVPDFREPIIVRAKTSRIHLPHPRLSQVDSLPIVG